MYRMLIVDDEPATVEGIKSAVNWALMGISICGAASDGIEALRMIDEAPPDIVLCDVRMPKMDGITLCNQIRLQYPAVRVIFLSGYSDKELLRSALRLNAIDYIYKPVVLAELIQAVEKAKASYDHNQHTKVPAQTSELALRLIREPDAEILADIGLDINSPMITLVVTFNMSFQPASPMDALLSNQHFQRICDLLAGVFGTRYLVSQTRTGCVTHANVTSGFDTDEELIGRLNRLFDAAVEYSGCMTVGIGSPVTTVHGLRDSYQQALQAVHSAFLTGYSRLIFSKDVSRKRFAPSEETKKLFMNSIDNNNIATGIDAFEKYVDYMQTCHPDDIPAIKDELMSMALYSNQKLARQQHMQQHIVDFFNHSIDILGIRQYIIQLMQQIQKNIGTLSQKDRIIYDIDSYILKNYDRDVSIEAIARHVYLTPTYLCHLYKEKTGKTINSFILEVKMNNSMKLLTDSAYRINEIADMLGYANQNYFAKVFKQFFGLSPSAVRGKQ